MIVLDASMALAWHIKRTSAKEAALAQKALLEVDRLGAVVPGLWFSEVANGLLIAERHGATTTGAISGFHSDLTLMDIGIDSALPHATFAIILSLGRIWKLTAYDAAYLELVLRTGHQLATFDRQLAEATRKAGGQVFGDRP
jgi:predicted nucleic acid-binding protein